jgi:hypothetical protein
MDPQATATEARRETPKSDEVQNNIARFVKEHEVAVNRPDFHGDRD